MKRPDDRWSKLPNRLVDDGHVANLTGMGAKVYMVLLRYAGSGGECWPTIAKLREHLSVAGKRPVSRMTIERAVTSLTDAGFISVDRPRGRSVRPTFTINDLLQPPTQSASKLSTLGAESASKVGTLEGVEPAKVHQNCTQSASKLSTSFHVRKKTYDKEDRSASKTSDLTTSPTGNAAISNSIDKKSPKKKELKYEEIDERLAVGLRDAIRMVVWRGGKPDWTPTGSWAAQCNAFRMLRTVGPLGQTAPVSVKEIGQVIKACQDGKLWYFGGQPKGGGNVRSAIKFREIWDTLHAAYLALTPTAGQGCPTCGGKMTELDQRGQDNAGGARWKCAQAGCGKLVYEDGKENQDA